jgi:hypothetical protein
LKKLLHAYFSHWTIWFYLIFAATLLKVTSTLKLFSTHHIIFFIIPILIAPFVEWVLHRYALHRKVGPNHPSYSYYEKLHYNHHRFPEEPKWCFAPFTSSLGLMVVVFLFFSLVTWNFQSGLMSLTSAVCYFLYYEWVHLSYHVAEFTPMTKRSKFIKKTHLWHHYLNENYWWGITSLVGDLVFKTRPLPGEVPATKSTREISMTE